MILFADCGPTNSIGRVIPWWSLFSRRWLRQPRGPYGTGWSSRRRGGPSSEATQSHYEGRDGSDSLKSFVTSPLPFFFDPLVQRSPLPLGPQTGCSVTRQVCHCRLGIGFRDDKPTMGLDGVKIKNHFRDFFGIRLVTFCSGGRSWCESVFPMHCEPKAIELPQPDGSTSSLLEVRSFCVPQCPVRKLLGRGPPNMYPLLH